MPSFRYVARDISGTTQSGVLVAGTIEMLTAELRARGQLVVDVEPIVERTGPGAITWNPLTWLAPTSFDVEVGFQQLATMLHSGLSLLSALRTVGEQARRPRAARVWDNLGRRIEGGSTLTDALAAHPKVFTEHVVQLIRVGEYAGTLDTSLTRATDHLERSRSMRLIVLNALTYPVIVVLMALGVSAFMVINVIPKIQKFLGGTGRRLPPITQSLVDVTNWVMEYLPYIGVGVLSSAIAITFIYRWPPGRRTIDAILLRLPVVGGILRLSGTAVFARGLSILLESGVTLLDSLTTIEHLVGNRVLSLRIAAARQAVIRGESLAGTMSGGRDFLPMLGRMIAVGEAAGTLAMVLAEVARFHEGQLVIAIRRMTVLVEPVIIIIVGGIVGFVYAAFFIAIFSLAGGGH